LSPAIKGLIVANVLMFVVQKLATPVTWALGLIPIEVVRSFYVWQLGTYMFLHAGVLHIAFNMLALWMFGTELERIWGTRYFLKFYFVTGVGAAILTVLFSLLPLGVAHQLQQSIIVGASGAIFGLLLAYALYFPDRPILMFFLFPVPAKYFVMIVGAIEFYSSLAELGGIANATHLGGLLVGYAYLKSARANPLAELKYRYLKWKINRVRKKFDVYSGGRANDWDRHVH
jgi:membrane associated rhomboid family serine protease